MVTDETIQQLKNCELQMLSCFIDTCEKLNLNYFLVGGTLLGAVRHKGFIPWDDDIDVGMFRKDYEIFLDKASEYLPEYYFLQSYKTDVEFPHNFAKLRDSRTTFVETTVKNLNINHGVFIDIFPFDYYPENKIASHILEIKKKILKLRIDLIFEYNEPIKYSLRSKIMVNISRMLYKNVIDAIQAREKIIKSCSESNLVTNHCGIWGKREIVPKEWMEETCMLQFENLMVKCPQNYDAYLTNIYDDYMTLPPIEKRIGHHYTEYIDLYNTYTQYVNLEK